MLAKEFRRSGARALRAKYRRRHISLVPPRGVPQGRWEQLPQSRLRSTALTQVDPAFGHEIALTYVQFLSSRIRRSPTGAIGITYTFTLIEGAKNNRPCKSPRCECSGGFSFRSVFYFFIASTCLATSSERSSLFFSRPSPRTKKQNCFKATPAPAFASTCATVTLSSLTNF